ncbi:MAG: DinB family protein [Candidatus Hydrogenedentes bacterium]|nr:DinB family protein [Candidatus Hydrogenedentota bacterium]
MGTQLAGSLVRELESSKEFFDRGTRALAEEDSSFVPEAGMMTAAQQVAHVAHTLDWFVQGMTRPEGFDLDFAAHAVEIAKVTSLKAAREWLDKAHKGVVTKVGRMTDEELNVPLPAGPVMGGAPKLAVVGAISDHTAHHRGALSVYTRLLGKVPPMPYMEM